MDDTFRKELIDAGISEAAIKVLEDQELISADSLKNMSYDRLVAMGVKAGSAEKISAKYGPRTAAPAPTNNPSQAEEVDEVKQGTAPIGTTATVQLFRPTNVLAASLGLPVAAYRGCSFCHANLDDRASRERIPVENMGKCPNCESIFVPEEVIFCYASGDRMTTAGVCLSRNCGAKRSDDDELKQITAWVRRNEGKNGRPAILAAMQYLNDPQSKAVMLAEARTGKLLRNYEEGFGGLFSPADTESSQNNDAEVAQLKELISQAMARLHARQLQAANYGIAADPSITLEVNKLQREVIDLNKKLQAASAALKGDVISVAGIHNSSNVNIGRNAGNK